MPFVYMGGYTEGGGNANAAAWAQAQGVPEAGGVQLAYNWGQGWLGTNSVHDVQVSMANGMAGYTGPCCLSVAMTQDQHQSDLSSALSGSSLTSGCQSAHAATAVACLANNVQFIRMAWEFNGGSGYNWMPPFGSYTAAQFRLLWQLIYNVYSSAAVSAGKPANWFKFVYCLNPADFNGAANLRSFYPGMPYAAYITIDEYDRSNAGLTGWNQALNDPPGLADIVSFALTQGAEGVGLPEWGIRNDAYGPSVIPDPSYITSAFAWAQSATQQGLNVLLWPWGAGYSGNIAGISPNTWDFAAWPTMWSALTSAVATGVAQGWIATVNPATASGGGSLITASAGLATATGTSQSPTTTGSGGGGGGSLTPVQTGRSSLYSDSVTLTSNITAGNGLAMFVSISGGASISAISGGDTWTIVNLIGTFLYLCYVPASVGGYKTITVTESAGVSLGEVVYEIPGRITLDKSAGADSGSAVTSWSSGSTAATTVSNEIWLGAVQVNQYTPTGPSGWTALPVIGSSGSNQILSGYKVQAATGTAVYSGTVPTADFYSAGVATFYSAAPSAVTASAGLATGTGTAQGPAPQVAFRAGLAAGAGAATEFIYVPTSPVAGLARAKGIAAAPVVRLVRFPRNLGGTASRGSLDASSGGAAVIPAFSLGGTLSYGNNLGGSPIGWTMQQVNLSLAENNDESVNFALTSGSSALDISTATVNVYLKSAAGTPDSTATVFSSTGPSPAVTITNGPGGLCTLALPHTALSSEAFTFYRVDVVFGGLQNTAIYGNITWVTL